MIDLKSIADLTHNETALLISIVNGIFGLWTAWLARRNRKDIDGVAIKAGTTRALARCEKKDKKNGSGSR